MLTRLLMCDSGIWVDAISWSICSQTLDISQTDLEHSGQQYLQPQCTDKEIIVRNNAADFHWYTWFANKKHPMQFIFDAWSYVWHTSSAQYTAPVKSNIPQSRKGKGQISYQNLVTHWEWLCISRKQSRCIVWPHCKTVMSFTESNRYCTVKWAYKLTNHSRLTHKRFLMSRIQFGLI
jgi:hypothetical protein